MTDLSSGTIADAIAATPPQPPSDHSEAARVLAATAALFDVTVDRIVGGGRQRKVIGARFVAIALIRARTRLSWPQIGEVVQRTHPTCMNAAEQVLASPERLAWAAAVQAELDREETP